MIRWGLRSRTAADRIRPVRHNGDSDRALQRVKIPRGGRLSDANRQDHEPLFAAPRKAKGQQDRVPGLQSSFAAENERRELAQAQSVRPAAVPRIKAPMTSARFLHHSLITLFAAFNGVVLYLFLLQLPYGLEPLILSFTHWRALSPQIEIVAALATVSVIGALLIDAYLSDLFKTRLLYARWQQAHPAHHAFFSIKDPGFDRKPLYAAYPAVKDSAYDPKTQFDTWSLLYRKHAGARLVRGTHFSWTLLRDLYLVSILFLGLFLGAWAVNHDVPIQIVSTHAFIFGAQTAFLLFSARSAGSRLVNNVLATELGLGPENADSPRDSKITRKKKARRSR